jgi:hypothetical protein
MEHFKQLVTNLFYKQMVFKVACGILIAGVIMTVTPSQSQALVTPPNFPPSVNIIYFFNFDQPIIQGVESTTPYKNVKSEITVNKDGLITCSLSATTVDSVFESTILNMQIDKPLNHRWVRDTRFKQKSIRLQADPSKQKISGQIQAGYNVLALGDVNSKDKLRINCESDLINNRINVGKKYFTVIAQITLNKTK